MPTTDTPATTVEARIDRLRAALTLIGTDCANYRAHYTCVTAGRTRDAQYGADRWCEQCIARDALEHDSQAADHAAPDRGEFCHRHFSWLCQAGQGNCQREGAAP